MLRDSDQSTPEPSELQTEVEDCMPVVPLSTLRTAPLYADQWWQRQCVHSRRQDSAEALLHRLLTEERTIAAETNVLLDKIRGLHDHHSWGWHKLTRSMKCLAQSAS